MPPLSKDLPLPEQAPLSWRQRLSDWLYHFVPTPIGIKDPLHNLFFCFPHPIKSTSYKREFVGNWGYAEAP